MKPSAHLAPALRHFSKDRHFAPLLAQYGHPTLAPQVTSPGVIFVSLTRAIVGQQISGKAAASIYARFASLFPRKQPTPARVLALDESVLRGCGLSRPKVSYLRDLAEKYIDKTIVPRTLLHRPSEEIISILTQVKGVGVWTVEMLLIFTLGRLDVLPTGDLGVRKGMQALYGLPALPAPKEMRHRASSWSEYASVGSWYLWRVADTLKKSRD